MGNNKKYISVFIPTYNGEKYIGELLNAVLNQELPTGYDLEVLVTDSGSTDNTLKILELYKDKTVVDEIPNSEFGHGKTRQRAAEKARGEFILFLSQDATPTNERWLVNMIEPFLLNEKVGCVFGRQIPRPDAAVTIKREVSTVFGGLGAPDSLVIHRHESLVDKHETNSLNSFFSDVNSAARRKLLIGQVPFRDVAYAEDQALAEDMQNKGYLKAYAPLGEVWHSNEYTAREYFHRKFDEFTGLQESVNYQIQPSLRSLLLGWIRPTLQDWKFLRKDADYSPWSKIVWFLEAPFYNIANKAGMYFSIRHFHNVEKRKKLSLEQRNK